MHISSNYFTAGLIVRNGLCVMSAPILKRRCLGKSQQWIEAYAKKGELYT